MFSTVMGRSTLFSLPDDEDLIPFPSDANDLDITETSVKERGPADPPTHITYLRAGAEASSIVARAQRLVAEDDGKGLTVREVMALDARLVELNARYPALIPFDGTKLVDGSFLTQDLIKL